MGKNVIFQTLNLFISSALGTNGVIVMKITLSAIKADVGSIGGHTQPSKELLGCLKEIVEGARGIQILDYRVGHTGDDMYILMSHVKGIDNPEIHGLAWSAFKHATDIAKKQGLWGAGQDLLVDAFAGNVKGLGPGVAELEMEERPSEAFVLVTTDKTGPGAFNVPLLRLCNPLWNDGLLISKDLQQGFTYSIMDMDYTDCDKVIDLSWPERTIDIHTLLLNPNRFAVQDVSLHVTGERFANISTTRLHNISGTYSGKDDPVMLMKLHKQLPACEEIIDLFRDPPIVPGGARGSHWSPLMPVPANYGMNPGCCSLVSCLGFSMHDGIISDFVDHFVGPIWEEERQKAAHLYTTLKRHNGSVMPAVQGMDEMEYQAGLMGRLKALEEEFYKKDR